MPLSHHIALVTGAGRGIGRAIALALAERGAAVALLARSADEVEEVAKTIVNAGGRAVALAVDVTDDAGVDAAIAQIRKSFGPISILVNNAGWAPPRTSLSRLDDDEIDRMLDTNLRAAIRFARLVLPEMRRAHGGIILSTASAFALEPHAGEAVYAATKAGLLAFSRALALECAAEGIRVGALCPGFVDTAFIPPNRRVDRKIFLRPEDVARAALEFCCAAEASGVDIAVAPIEVRA